MIKRTFLKVYNSITFQRVFLSDKKSRKFNWKVKVLEGTECCPKSSYILTKLTEFQLKCHGTLNERLLNVDWMITKCYLKVN